MGHSLQALLCPRSIALIGASAREGSVGNTLLRQINHGGFTGTVRAVNPRYENIEGTVCVPSLRDLDRPVEHAVLAVADAHALSALDEAIACGVRAVTVLGSLVGEVDGLALRQAFAERAKAAGVQVCGAMSMGFYNFDAALWVGGFPTRSDHRPGPISLVTQSGSVFSALLDVDDRLEWNLAVSSGQELTTTVADYLDYALDLPTTRVIGLFLESIRDPEAFVRGLEKSREAGIPIVAIKVGRSERAARLAQTHSGALVGHDSACQALFERYGVIRVVSLDDMAATLLAFAQPRPIGDGALAAIHDSGGERSLFVDLADDIDVPFATLAPATLERIQSRLDAGLVADNPLDAWGTGQGYIDTFRDALRDMVSDSNTAIGALVADRAPGGATFPEYRDCVREVAGDTGKPVFLVSPHSGSGGCADANAMAREGFPSIDGMSVFLRAVNHLLRWRDQKRVPVAMALAAPAGVSARWRTRLSSTAQPGDELALELLRDYGVPVARHCVVDTVRGAVAVATTLGFPVALKALVPGHAHKSDIGAVRLGLGDAGAVEGAARELRRGFNACVLVMEMLPAGVEVLFGMKRDPQFGPIVTIGAGGMYTEILRDTVVALPPFDVSAARSLIDRLRMRPLLDSVRGRPAADVDALAEAAARFSVLAHDLGDAVEEFDVNPLIAGAGGCAAVDAFLVLSRTANELHQEQAKEVS